MLDPISIGLAFTAAQNACKLIKQGLAAGKDISATAGAILEFMENKDKVAAAASADKSDSKTAMATVMRAHKLKEEETQLKDMLMLSGNGQLWVDMLAERLRIQKERKAAEVARKNKLEQFKRDAEEVGDGGDERRECGDGGRR